MSSCPHLTSTCDATDRRELASCPGVDPSVLITLVSIYPVETAGNPLLPMLALESPTLWGPIAANVGYEAAKTAWLSSLFNFDGRALQRFGLEATERLWWMRLGCKNEKARRLLDATRSLQSSPCSHAAIEHFAKARREALNYMRATIKGTPSGLVMRALYFFSGTNPGEYRHALGILTDAVRLAQQKKHGLISAIQLAMKEVAWQRERWEAQQ